MKALVINRFGSPEQFQLKDVLMPIPGRGEVLVRVHAAGLNPVDAKFRSGGLVGKVSGRKFPRILGGDIAGVVEHARQGSAFRPGDRVFALLPTYMGGYAEFARVKERHLAHIPDYLSMTEAAAIPMAGITALRSLLMGRPLQAKEKLLINGASGGVGSLAVLLAKAIGAHVTAVCSSPNVSFVQSLGADEVLDYTKEDYFRLPGKFHKVFDAAGKSSFSKSRRVLHKDGIYVSTLPSLGLVLHQPANLFRGRKAYLVVARASGNDLELIGKYLSSRQMHVPVENTFSVYKIAQAHKFLVSGKSRGKTVLKILE
jgi:NADPH:quinone reductase-like Zn-dependent oxidoreductase